MCTVLRWRSLSETVSIQFLSLPFDFVPSGSRYEMRNNSFCVTTSVLFIRLLQTAGCFTSEPTTTAYISSSEVLKKRVTFVRCLAKLLITCTNKYKAALAADTATAGKLKEALADIFFTVDQVVTRGTSAKKR